MRNIARLSDNDRRELFRNTADKMGLNDAIVEKDFWVCFTLDYLFHRSPWKESITFKGGTSLSKAFHLISRFSEDIDLILDWRVLGYGKDEPWEKRSNTKQDAFNKEANARAEVFLSETFCPAVKAGLSQEIGCEANVYIDEKDKQTVIFAYPHLFTNTATLQVIRLEIGALAAWTPAKTAQIEPYAAKYYPKIFEQKETAILTVAPERTFWEKATILHHEANRPEHLEIQPPRLYDLTTLQRECNRIYGYTAQQTLDYVQSLYEKKLATYPRTDSQYLTKDMQATAASLILWLRDNMTFGKGYAGEPDIDRVTDDSKVTDHHAIIPTVEIARTDLSELPSGERDVLTLLAVRLLCATTQVHRFEAVTAILDCQGYTFTAKGKTILQSGWKEVERIHRMSIRQSETEHKENEAVALPVLQEGQTFEAVSASLREGKTSPPKHYTEDTLLSAMETAGAEDMPEDAERKGLGTPATRAATLEKLVSAGFVQRKKKQLIPTEKGKNLIAVLPDNIKSPILTAEWESMLKQVEHGELSATSFMDQIADMSRTLVKEHTTPEERFADLFPSSKGTAHEAVGVCPRCGAPVFEGKKGFFCGNRECSFALWKDNRFFSSKKKSITKSVAAALLKEGRISMSGLYSEKTGRTYDAEVILDDTGGKYVNFKLEFPVKKGRRK